MYKVQLVLKELQVLKVQLVLKEKLVKKDKKVLLVHKEFKVFKV